MCIGIWGFGFAVEADAGNPEAPRHKNPTSNEIHKIIATADLDQLRASLYKLDYILPPNGSHESVIEFANKVVDRQIKNLDMIDARASYPRWDDTSKWIPAKRMAKAAQRDEDRQIVPQIVLEL